MARTNAQSRSIRAEEWKALEGLPVPKNAVALPHFYGQQYDLVGVVNLGHLAKRRPTDKANLWFHEQYKLAGKVE